MVNVLQVCQIWEWRVPISVSPRGHRGVFQLDLRFSVLVEMSGGLIISACLNQLEYFVCFSHPLAKLRHILTLLSHSFSIFKD